MHFMLFGSQQRSGCAAHQHFAGHQPPNTLQFMLHAMFCMVPVCSTSHSSQPLRVRTRVIVSVRTSTWPTGPKRETVSLLGDWIQLQQQ